MITCYSLTQTRDVLLARDEVLIYVHINGVIDQFDQVRGRVAGAGRATNFTPAVDPCLHSLEPHPRISVMQPLGRKMHIVTDYVYFDMYVHNSVK